jgi:hypothetical protein
VCLYHYSQIPAVPHKNVVSKTGRLRPGQSKKRLPCQIDESCTALVGTSMPPQKKKKEEGGAKFKCNYSGHGKPPRQVFNDKYLELLKQNGCVGGGNKLPNTWVDCEVAYNDLMQIMGKKVQCQLLGRRAGGAAGSQAEPGCVQDERVQNENLDDGVSPDKKMGESGGWWGVTALNSVMVMVKVVGGGRGWR